MIFLQSSGLTNGLPLYFDLQDRIDELLIALEACYESMNTIALWQSMNNIRDDSHREEMQKEIITQMKEEFGEETGTLLEKMLFD